jgi:hypothetical protein
MPQTWPQMPASIAGVTRKVECTRQRGGSSLPAFSSADTSKSYSVGVAGIWFWLWEWRAVHLFPYRVLYNRACNFHEVAFRSGVFTLADGHFGESSRLWNRRT